MTTTAQTIYHAPKPNGVPRAALSAAAVSIPHALGLGLIAYGPLAASMPVASLVLWSAALPGALAALLVPRPGVVYAPTTVVALLYGGVVSTLAAAANELGMGPQHILAACGFTAALGFAFQCLFGLLRLASLARFLPISVVHGFAAGVGLSMVVGQLRHGFGAGGLHPDTSLLIQAATALAVAGLAYLANRRWPRLPGVLVSTVAVGALLWAAGVAQGLPAATPDTSFALPLWPDYAGVPWIALFQRHGTHLVSLALLMAVINSLDVSVFHQELDLEHGVRADTDASLRRESLVGVLCALAGLIPASTSASRTRILLAQGVVSTSAGTAHAAILCLVAATGHWWLHWVPMACLSGALLLVGISQIPGVLWSPSYARASFAPWAQSWLVAVVFCLAGGPGALVAGLVVATFVLLHTSASTALRRWHLDGQVRSRRLRRTNSEAWLASRMNTVAVFELQGVMSFGVAAYVAAQVKDLLAPHHDRVIIDAHRVAAWDATSVLQLRALGRELDKRGCRLALSSLGWRECAALGTELPIFADLDRALEWAEEALLEERASMDRTAQFEAGRLGDLADGLHGDARQDLEQELTHMELQDNACVFGSGAPGRELYIVERGVITIASEWPPSDGVRIASIGQGVPFGEMAFLTGQQRSAYAGAAGSFVSVSCLSRESFDRWASKYPGEALLLMRNLALVGTHRLATTTRQLRAVLE